MKKEYFSPEFELQKFKFTGIMAGEVVVSDPQFPEDEINTGEND